MTPEHISKLLRSQSHLLIQGEEVALALARLHDLIPISLPIDLREAGVASNDSATRQRVSQGLRSSPTVILIVGEDLHPAVKGLISELREGQVNFAPGDTRRADAVKLVVVCAGAAPRGWANDFAVRLKARDL